MRQKKKTPHHPCHRIVSSHVRDLTRLIVIWTSSELISKFDKLDVYLDTQSSSRPASEFYSILNVNDPKMLASIASHPSLHDWFCCASARAGGLI
jgi:hypothetical protein